MESKGDQNKRIAACRWCTRVTSNSAWLSYSAKVKTLVPLPVMLTKEASVQHTPSFHHCADPSCVRVTGGDGLVGLVANAQLC
jgi:hypothetical protein